MIEEQHIFEEFGYFHVPSHKCSNNYRDLAPLCLDISGPSLLIQRKARAFSHRRTKGNLQRISRTTLMALNIKTTSARNIWILMLYSAFHRLGVNANCLEFGMFFLICALNCVAYIYLVCQMECLVSKKKLSSSVNKCCK